MTASNKSASLQKKGKRLLLPFLLCLISSAHAIIAFPDDMAASAALIVYFLVSYAVLFAAATFTDDIAKLYLVFTILMGIGYMVLLPPNAVPDEMAHFFRIFDISGGNMTFACNENGVGGAILPKNIFIDARTYEDVLSALPLELDYSRAQFMEMPSSALYFPTCYFPQALGALVARFFTDNVLTVIYSARLANFLFGTALIYASIKVIPYGKMILFAIASMPMFLHQQISLSADVMTNALAVFVVSYTLYLSRKKALSMKQLLVLFAAIALLTTCKIVYILFAFIVFILPNANFKSKKAALAYKVLTVFFALGLNLFWLIYSSKYYVEFQAGVNITSQIKFVLSRPLSYIGVLLRTLFHYDPFYAESLIAFYIESMAGRYLEWADVQTHFIGYVTALMLLVASVFFSGQNKDRKFTKMVMFLISGATVLAILSALYAQWTPVAHEVVIGVQGRYFIPILLPLALSLPNGFSLSRSGVQKKTSNIRAFCMFFVFSNSFAIVALMQKFLDF